MPTADEISQLRATIEALEAQRPILTDAVVETALGPLREKLAALEAASQPAQPEQQRKLATILFIDIAGHTQAVRDLDPEENLAIIDHALARLAEPVATFGGRVVRFQGDGFKAVFGLPTAQENDPENAVRAALSIQDTAAQIAQELAAEHAMTGFQVRVGINTGLIVAGGVTEGEDAVSGIPVNLAARLESAAEPGTTLISHDTYRHIRGVFDVQPVEPIQVRGAEGLVQTYIVQKLKPRAFRLPTRGVEGIETRMIGRDAELRMLQSAYTNVIEGAVPHLVTIIGEAGIGKSRLLYEFDNWIELRPEQVYYFKGRSATNLQNVSFSLLRDLFAYRFAIRESDSVADALHQFRAGMAGVLTSDQADVVGYWLGFDFSASEAVGRLSGSPDLATIAQPYLTRYFRALAADGPVVILLEDLHWADDHSLDVINDLLIHLATGDAETRLLIVCCARRTFFERRPLWGNGQPFTSQITLTPLSRHASQALVEEILQRVSNLPAILRDLIVESAEGNPFFVEELVKMLIDQGVITRDATAEQWWVAEKLDTVRVPATLLGLLQARLDALPRPERKALQCAAVVGRVFWDDAVSGLVQQPREELQTTLAAVCRHELIFRREHSAFVDTGEYIFKHNLLRDVAYETVLLRYRREYHRQVAQWLESHAGVRLSEYLGLISEHYIFAGENHRAADYLEQAGNLSLRKGSYKAARHAFERALSLLSSDTSAAKSLTSSRLKLGEACYELADYAAAEATLTTALVQAREQEDGPAQAEVLYRLSEVAFRRGDYTQMQRLLDESLPLARLAGGKILIRVLLGMYRVGWHAGQLDDVEAYLTEGLALAEAQNDPDLQYMIYTALANVAITSSEYDTAIHYLQACLAIARQIGQASWEAKTLGNMAVAFHFKGDLAQAASTYRAALALNRELNQPAQEASNLLNLAELYLDHGNPTDARQELQAGLRIADRVGSLPEVLFSLFVYARILAYEYDTTGALRLLGLLLHHPANQRQTKPQIEAEIGRMDLPTAKIEAGLAAGTALDLGTVVAEILSTK